MHVTLILRLFIDCQGNELISGTVYQLERSHVFFHANVLLFAAFFSPLTSPMIQSKSQDFRRSAIELNQKIAIQERTKRVDPSSYKRLTIVSDSFLPWKSPSIRDLACYRLSDVIAFAVIFLPRSSLSADRRITWRKTEGTNDPRSFSNVCLGSVGRAGQLRPF